MNIKVMNQIKKDKVYLEILNKQSIYFPYFEVKEELYKYLVRNYQCETPLCSDLIRKLIPLFLNSYDLRLDLATYFRKIVKIENGLTDKAYIATVKNHYYDYILNQLLVNTEFLNNQLTESSNINFDQFDINLNSTLETVFFEINAPLKLFRIYLEIFSSISFINSSSS